MGMDMATEASIPSRSSEAGEERGPASLTGHRRVNLLVGEELRQILQRKEALLALDDDAARRGAGGRLERHQHLRLQRT